jgi:cytoskeletal protein CcmA (bactofilin family)
MNEIKRIDEAHNSDNLIIGEGVSFTGSIEVPNLAIINGKFEGEITARKLIVDTDGHVSGTSNATDIEVKGVLKSTVLCSNLLTIHATGSIDGSMEYGEIEIERGGKFSGSMKQR